MAGRISEKVDGRRNFWLAVPAIILAVLLKIWLLVAGSIPFNADEAIVALMARHILQGERPLFFYGQAYMGSLDAWLVAAGFVLFGAHVWVIRAVQVVLYVLIMASTAWLGSLVFRSWKPGVIAAWLLAIPTVNVTLYTTASLGGYGEALLIGNLILILGLLILRRSRDGDKPASLLWLLFGFLIGLGFWANGLTLVYSIPMIFYLASSGLAIRAEHTPSLAKGISPRDLAGNPRGARWISSLGALRCERRADQSHRRAGRRRNCRGRRFILGCTDAPAPGCLLAVRFDGDLWFASPLGC